MNFFFMLARTYPYWAIPSGLVAGELAIFFRRKRNQFEKVCWAVVVAIVIGLLFWLYFMMT